VTLPTPLYVILDRGAAGGRGLGPLLDAVLEGGCRLVQLREKTMPLADLYPVARALRRRCRDAGCLFIVNDRVDLALAVEADGVHVGQDDLPAREARRILRQGMILGVSTHDAGQARRARDDGADYVAVGSIPTGSKPDFQLVGPAHPARASEIRWRSSHWRITVDNVLTSSGGADAVAVIRLSAQRRSRRGCAALPRTIRVACEASPGRRAVGSCAPVPVPGLVSAVATFCPFERRLLTGTTRTTWSTMWASTGSGVRSSRGCGPASSSAITSR
jgi:thiamine-phosphate pyrophosphorylase